MVSLSLALLLPGPAAAIQRATPQSIRVTSGASHVHSTGRSWGRYFAFSSPIDLTGEGSTASQVYVFSVVDYTCQFGRHDVQLDTEEPWSADQPGLEGGRCELDALIEEIKGRPFGSITGRRLPRKLTRLVLRVRVKVELATRAANPKAIALLTASDKKLQRFEILVKKGFGFDRISETLMHQTMDRAQDARTIIQGVKANLR